MRGSRNDSLDNQDLTPCRGNTQEVVMSVSVAPPEIVPLPVGVLSRARAHDGSALNVAVRQSLAHLAPWMPWATADAADGAAQEEFIRDAEAQWNVGTDYVYLLRPVASAPVQGMFGLHRRIGPRALELGYWVHVAHVGRGLATAAAGALVSVGLDLDDVDRVEIHTDAANTASAAVARRLGLRLARTDLRPPQSPAQVGCVQIWIRETT